MSKDAENRDASKRTRKTGATRRSVLITMASGMLTEKAYAHGRRHHHIPFANAAQQQNFTATVQAFNNMNSTRNIWLTQGALATPLGQLLDPNVKAFKLSTGGPITGVVDVVNFFYNLAAINSNGQPVPQFNPNYNGTTPDFSVKDMVKSRPNQPALWTDSDGTNPDPLPYSFKFDSTSNKLVYLHSA